MVGGTIVAIRPDGVDHDGDEVLLVTVAEKRYSRHDFCAVRMLKTNHPVKLGDSLWWQSGKCYWTPEPSRDVRDVPIPKIGYSFDPTVVDPA